MEKNTCEKKNENIVITYAAENPLALIVSSDLNLRSKAASTETISGGIWKWRKTKINKKVLF